jgi:hypothetical protein
VFTIRNSDCVLVELVRAHNHTAKPSAKNVRYCDLVVLADQEPRASAALRHEWLADLLGGRPSLGPNGLAVTEAGLAALDGRAGIDTVMRAVETVSAYVRVKGPAMPDPALRRR